MKLYNKFKQTLPDVSGKVFVITGTTSGTGFVAARIAAEKGGEVLLLNRPSPRVDESLAKLKEAVPEGKFVTIDCDLQDFASVRAAAEKVRGSYDKIYSLVNNAGIMALPNQATKDGYDVQMQTNHLSHFLLTAELFPLIKAAAGEYGDARIVQHSSIARNKIPTKSKTLEEKFLRKNGGKDILGDDSMNMMSLSGGMFTRYHHSKLANSLFCHALHERLQASSDEHTKKIRSVCAHPGVSKTNLGSHLQMGAFMRFVFSMMTQCPDDAALGIITGMMAKDAESDALYGPKNDKMSGPAVVNPAKPWEIDQLSKDLLWKVSEEECGVKFTV